MKNSESVVPNCDEVQPLVIRKVLSQESKTDKESRIFHRWKIRRFSQRILCAALPKDEWPRVVRCGWSLGALVSLLGASGGRASWSGVEHCNSLWACPLCSARIREGRRQEIQEGFEKSKALGWKAWFITFTVPHSIETPLEKSLGAIRSAYAKMRRYSSLKSFWSSVEGVIKATEVQVGSHGFHPHLHCIFFTSSDSIDELGLKSAWAKAVVKEGLARPSDSVGVVVKEATTKGLSKYLTKIQENKITLEVARGDLKRGRVSNKTEWHCSPFDLIDCDVELPISVGLRKRLWVDYYRATKGTSAIRWSKGLKKRLSIGEVSDDELGKITPEEAEAELRFLKKQYNCLFKEHPAVLAKCQALFKAGKYEAAGALVAGYGELLIDNERNEG